MLCFSAHNQAQYQWHSWLCVDSQDWERVHIYSEICGVLAPTECPATWRWDTPSLPGVVSRSGPTLSQCRRDGGEEGKVWLDREIGLVVPFLPFMPLPLPPPPSTNTHTTVPGQSWWYEPLLSTPSFFFTQWVPEVMRKKWFHTLHL